jgi:hypothetical protein
MEMLLQPANVVFIRMRQEKRIDVKPAFLVPIQPVAQLLRHIRRLVVLIVRSGADVDVDQNPPAAFELDQGHVPIVDAEMYRFHHLFYPPARAMKFPVSLFGLEPAQPSPHGMWGAGEWSTRCGDQSEKLSQLNREIGAFSRRMRRA